QAVTPPTSSSAAGSSSAGGRSYLFRQIRRSKGPSGINPGFPGLSRCRGLITHVLLTRSPLSPARKGRFSLDLHVLSAPPAFVLSQDQTLREEMVSPEGESFVTLSLCSKSSPRRPVKGLFVHAGCAEHSRRGLDVTAR